MLRAKHHPWSPQSQTRTVLSHQLCQQCLQTGLWRRKGSADCALALKPLLPPPTGTAGDAPGQASPLVASKPDADCAVTPAVPAVLANGSVEAKGSADCALALKPLALKPLLPPPTGAAGDAPGQASPLVASKPDADCAVTPAVPAVLANGSVEAKGSADCALALKPLLPPPTGAAGDAPGQASPLVASKPDTDCAVTSAVPAVACKRVCGGEGFS